MKTFNNIILLLSLVFLYTCTLEEDSYMPSQYKFQKLFIDAFQDKIQHFELEASTGVVGLVSQDGIQISLNTDDLTLNGNPVSGSVNLDYVDIFDAKNMLVTNRSTMAMIDGSEAVLASGGEFYIQATQGDQLLDINGDIQLSIPNNISGMGDMSLWEGIVDENNNLTWVPFGDINWIGNPDFTSSSTVVFTVPGFGYWNCDDPIPSNPPHSTIHVKAPDKYNLSNSGAFLFYDNMSNGLGRLNAFTDEGYFTAGDTPFPFISLGTQMHLIFVSEYEGDFIYDIRGFTVAPNDTFEIEDHDMRVTDRNGLMEAVNHIND